MNKFEQEELEKAFKLLIGKRIVDVSYLSEEDTEMNDWRNRPLCLELDDGLWIYPMRDDEGNDGGSIGTSSMKKDLQTLYSISMLDTIQANQEDRKVIKLEDHIIKEKKS